MRTSECRTTTAWRAALGRHETLIVGVTLLGFLVLLGVVARFSLPPSLHQNLQGSLSSPGQNGYVLGSDLLGRDVLAWTAAGILTACQVSGCVVALAAALGIAVGLLAGYQGGALDAVLMCLVNLQLAVPPLLFFIAASVVVGHTMGALIILLALFSWVPYARLVRTKVMLERQSDYVSGARLAGSSRLRILLVHLLPGCAGLIVTFASVQAGLVLLWESGLSFLGVGLQPPDVSLGFLIQQGRADMLGAPWVAVCPGLAIVLLVVAFNVIGNGLRDAFHIDAKL